MSIDPLERVRGWTPGPWPFEVALLLDDEQGMTDAIVTSDGQAFLLEMIDWGGPRLSRRIYRIAALADDIWQAFRHNLSRGSCDLTRAGNELAALAAASDLLPALVAADVSERRLLAVSVLPTTRGLPTRSWRNGLPDDATWFAAVSISKSGSG